MDTFEIKLHNAPADSTDMATFLNELFAPGSENYQQLKHAIEREFRPNGSPELIRLDIDRVKFDAATGKGSFRIVLDINYTFGCEDLLIEKENQTSEWTFFIDKGLQIIFFYGSPYIDSRSTADEF